MPAIIIELHPNQKFSAFAAVREIIKKSKTQTSFSKHIDIQLLGFTKKQYEAICELLRVVRDNDAYMKFTDQYIQPASESAGAENLRNAMSIKIPYDMSKKSVTIALSVEHGGQLPFHKMQIMLDALGDAIEAPRSNNLGIKTEKGFCNTIYFPDTDLLHIALPVVALIARAHGHDSETIAPLLSDNPKPTALPAIAVPSAIYKDIVNKERLRAAPAHRR